MEYHPQDRTPVYYCFTFPGKLGAYLLLLFTFVLRSQGFLPLLGCEPQTFRTIGKWNTTRLQPILQCKEQYLTFLHCFRWTCSMSGWLWASVTPSHSCTTTLASPHTRQGRSSTTPSSMTKVGVYFL